VRGLKGDRLERESPTGWADGAHLGFKALARSTAAAGHHSKIRRENTAQGDWFRERCTASGVPAVGDSRDRDGF